MKIGTRIKNAVSDMFVMSGRSTRHSLRSMDTLITVIGMPIMMMFMFVYVVSGVIDTHFANDINFVVPGIVLMCIMSSVAYTAFRLNKDITQGIIDRFRCMPIAKSAILGGQVLSSIVFNAISVLIVLVAGLIIGFRPDARIASWFLVIGILLLFTFAMTWISVVFGLLANSAEGAGAFAYVLLFLLFTSSAFVPTKSMHGLLRVFAEHQPMTPIIETMRSLLGHGNAGPNAWIAVSWCVGLLAAAYFAALRIYKNKTI